jgi:hypothetical protein
VRQVKQGDAHYLCLRRPVANSYSFGLKKYGFNEVITNNVSFFRQQFIEEIDQNLSC